MVFPGSSIDSHLSEFVAVTLRPLDFQGNMSFVLEHGSPHRDRQRPGKTPRRSEFFLLTNVIRKREKSSSGRDVCFQFLEVQQGHGYRLSSELKVLHA